MEGAKIRKDGIVGCVAHNGEHPFGYKATVNGFVTACLEVWKKPYYCECCGKVILLVPFHNGKPVENPTLCRNCSDKQWDKSIAKVGKKHGPMSVQEKVLRSRLGTLLNLPEGQRSEVLIRQLRKQITSLEEEREKGN